MGEKAVVQCNEDLDFHSNNLIASTDSAKSEHLVELTYVFLYYTYLLGAWCWTYLHWIFDLKSESNENIFNARYHAQSIILLIKYGSTLQNWYISISGVQCH